VVQGWGGAGLLDSYDAQPRPVFAATAEGFFEAAWSARATGAPEVLAFEPNYRGSPVVCSGPEGRRSARGRHAFAAQAGHHLAPVTLSGGALPVPGSAFTLLPSGDQGAAVAAFRAAAAAGAPLSVITDPGPGRYGAPLVLVRPDHFVIYAGAACDAGAILSRAVGADSI